MKPLTYPVRYSAPNEANGGTWIGGERGPGEGVDEDDGGCGYISCLGFRRLSLAGIRGERYQGHGK
eukprot:1390714-Amorphochlora_amoeboformis.AAC.1